MSESSSLNRFLRRSTSVYPGNSVNGVANGNSAKTDTTSSSTALPFKKANPHVTFEQSGLSAYLSSALQPAIVDGIRHKEAIDDRKLLLEHGLSLLSKFPPGEVAQKLQDDVIKLLYNDLSHPPATLIGNKYAWRSADGSGNNIGDPDLGKAGSTYARSVQQSHPLSPSELPDPGLIFDTLLKREGFQSHPSGLSSLMFSFAALVIHSVFRTSHNDVNINETSSYCDLAPLYGHNQETQNRVRRKEGLGLLHPDVFAEDRLLLLPPAVCVLLVLFNRNHNYIAKKIFDINERKKYQDPSKLSEAALAAQDEELFQTARLVNCGWFGTVIFSDYVSCILGLVRQGSSWSLNPFGEMRNLDHSEFERGRGNSCSVEFNCLYRWHATTSKEDELWTVQKMQQIFPGKKIENLTAMDFVMGAKKAMDQLPDLSHWTIGDLNRKEDGTFKDEDLANLLKNATEHPAGAFRARGTPECMRLHEIMGITQNRSWGVCSLNDFRRYLGLKPFSTFLEWNSDPEIAYAAEKLYGNIEYLELYVGLQAEEAKPVVEGAGLCPGYTISRAILSDAIALTRGDRYFTHDFTPFNLTAWGFADCQRQPEGYGFGSALGRLFLRTLPEQFTENSTYAFFPLMTPQSMKVYLEDLKLSEQYDMSRPRTRNPGLVARDYTLVGNIIKDPKFIAHYEKRAKDVVSGKGYVLRVFSRTGRVTWLVLFSKSRLLSCRFFSVPEDRSEQQRVLGALAGTPESSAELTKFFFEKTQELIKSNSFNLSGSKTRSVNLVRDVLRTAPMHWIADLSGIKIKTSPSDDGDFTAVELYNMLGDIYSYIFLDPELSKLMVLKEKAQSHAKVLLEKIENGLGGSISSKIFLLFSLFSKSKKPTEHIIVQHLHEIGYTSSREQGNVLLAIMVGSVELSVACTNMVNLYLDSQHEEAIRQLALAGDKEGELAGYAREALRLDPSFKGVYRIASSDHNVDGLNIQKDGRVFLDLYAAGQNDQVFPQPDTVNARRDQSGKKYIIMTHVLRGIFAIKDIQRAPGNSGVLNRFKDHERHELNYAYLDDNKYVSPWPNSLAVVVS
ncbi:linoleate diol synthase [Lentinula aciculospora]|uniref:Linoleate diol synthase n=1 Tax=Lentinula aciculospora TaxID=153920 RepID=A0A9W8ZXG2_9AGAR|nr:linoleate diol synthase [Lentinula aciculospora]